MTETITQTQTYETVQMKLQTSSSTQLAPQPPAMPKPKGKLRLDPQRALEPAKKKLTTLESERVMAVLIETIKRTQLVSLLPHIAENLERYRVSLGTDLVKLIEEHQIIVKTFESMKADTEKFLEKEEQENEEGIQSRPSSAGSNMSQSEMAIRNLAIVAQQMQNSVKSILRAFSLNPAAMNAILDADKDQDKTREAADMINEMKELKDIIMNKLLTTPVEESERNNYLKQISERERFNAGVIEKLETELAGAVEDKEEEVVFEPILKMKY